MEQDIKTHKAGFVNIIGKPNAGKSTLSNLLVGEHLSIITPKASTTRHRILGLINTDDSQIVLSDTPGIIEPAYKLHDSMMTAVKESIDDADVLIVLVDVTNPNFKDEQMALIAKATCPIILVVNKIDLSDPKEVEAVMKKLSDQLNPKETFAISALNGFNPESMIAVINQYLPEHEAFYPKDQLTDRNVRFFVSEMIREKIFHFYEQEIPYSTEVIVHDYQEGKTLDKIYAYIIVERDSQKGIIVGKQGSGIKRIGVEARKDIEKFVGKKVFLDLRVKVEEDWRKNELKLKHWGYME
ncbi:MAG: GTPase Era [Bacteroidota bacterium]|nr:GTPase Era [Bacteroidota bacterium]